MHRRFNPCTLNQRATRKSEPWNFLLIVPTSQSRNDVEPPSKLLEREREKAGKLPTTGKTIVFIPVSPNSIETPAGEEEIVSYRRVRWLTLIVARCMGAHVARRSRFPTAGYHRCHGNAIKDPLNLYRGTGVIGVSVDPSDYQNYDIVLARMEFAGAEIFEFFLSPIHLPISDSSHSPFVGTFSDNSYVVLSIVEICTSSNFHSPGRNNSAEREAASDTTMDYSVHRCFPNGDHRENISRESYQYLTL